MKGNKKTFPAKNPQRTFGHEKQIELLASTYAGKLPFTDPEFDPVKREQRWEAMKTTRKNNLENSTPAIWNPIIDQTKIGGGVQRIKKSTLLR